MKQYLNKPIYYFEEFHDFHETIIRTLIIIVSRIINVTLTYEPPVLRTITYFQEQDLKKSYRIVISLHQVNPHFGIGSIFKLSIYLGYYHPYYFDHF